MEENNKRIETWRIGIFLGITFVLTFVYCLTILYPAAGGTAPAILSVLPVQMLVSVVMLIPSVGVLLTRLITREGFSAHWLNPKFKGNIAVYLIAWFGPGILILLGAGLYFLIFPGRFDINCGYLAQTMAAVGGMTAMPLWMMMVIQGVQALLLGPILNFVYCFGEEWGWRGYLLPKLSAKLSPLPLLLISGFIWGLWHAPLTVVGHNYGLGYWGYPFTGIVAMCIFCIAVGTFFSWITLKSGSCLPAVLSHGALNAIAAIGVYFTTDGGNPFVGPAATGIIGGMPFILTAVLLYFVYFRKQKNNPEA